MKDNFIKELINEKIRAESGVDSKKPIPLTIAHSLQIQTITWRQESLYACLSGDHFLLAFNNGSSLKTLVMQRTTHLYPDQPYWHLNNGVRKFQSGEQDSYLHLREKGEKIKYVARKNPGRGLKMLYECNTGFEKRKMKEIRSMCEKSWITALFPEKESVYQCIRWDCASDCFCSNEDHFKKAHPASSMDRDYLDPYTHKEVGWYATKANRTTLLPSVDHHFQLGTYILHQAKDLLFYIDNALRNVPARVSELGIKCRPPCVISPLKNKGYQKCYRGVGAQMDQKLYSRGNVVLWSQFSSTSLDQGISQAYAKSSSSASVFIVQGFSCRKISPWSRFAREEEWTYPLNSMFEVLDVLSEESQHILGKEGMHTLTLIIVYKTYFCISKHKHKSTGFQLFQLSEVNLVQAEIIQVKKSLMNADRQTARIIFSACSAIKSGHGVLDLSRAGAPPAPPVEEEAGWSSTVTVLFNAEGLAPLRTNNSMMKCDIDFAKACTGLASRMSFLQS